jgi:hypothetical protein
MQNPPCACPWNLTRASGLLCAVLGLSGPLLADSSVTVAPDLSTENTSAISSDFIGLSFEKSYLEPSHSSEWTGYFFDTNTSQSPDCQEVQMLFKNMNIENLRIAGQTVDQLVYNTDYTNAAIDALFGFGTKITFGGSSGLKFVYGLRLFGSTTYDPQSDSKNESAYIWGNAGYQSALDCFSLGNEPNWHSNHTYTGHTVDPEISEATSGVPGSAYPSYAHNTNGEWKEFASSIVATDGGATFGGPDTGDEGSSTTTWWNDSGTNKSWTQALIDDRSSGNIGQPIFEATQHEYPGGGTNNAGNSTTAIVDMLSTSWSDTSSGTYEAMWNAIIDPVAVTDGWKFRMTEANDYTVSGGTGQYNGSGACDRFAGAMWALDYLNWWAWKSKKTNGVNFHTKMGNPTATIYQDSNGNFQANPRAAGLKMFYLGSHDSSGNALSKIGTVTVSYGQSYHPNNTAYALAGPHDLYVTYLNKTSSQAGDASVIDLTVAPVGISTATSAEYILMESYPTQHDATQTEATVGDGSGSDGLFGPNVTNTSLWSGHWITGLSVTSAGKCTINGLGSVSAVVVHISY